MVNLGPIEKGKLMGYLFFEVFRDTSWVHNSWKLFHEQHIIPKSICPPYCVCFGKLVTLQWFATATTLLH